MSNVNRAETHVIRDYPKWIEHEGEQVLVRSEEAELKLISGAEDDAEYERMIKELEENYDKTIDRRTYHKEIGGFAKLKAYYEAVIAREGE